MFGSETVLEADTAAESGTTDAVSAAGEILSSAYMRMLPVLDGMRCSIGERANMASVFCWWRQVNQ